MTDQKKYQLEISGSPLHHDAIIELNGIPVENCRIVQINLVAGEIPSVTMEVLLLDDVDIDIPGTVVNTSVVRYNAAKWDCEKLYIISMVWIAFVALALVQ